MTAPRAEFSGPTPLSLEQERVWSKGRSILRIPPMVLRFEGQVCIPSLQQSLDDIVRRHESLRTSFRGPGPEVVVVPERPVCLAVSDLRGRTGPQQDTEIKRLLRLIDEEPFDLANDPLLRAHLICLGERRHILAFTVHHIVCDLWSMSILVREWSTRYSDYIAGRDSSLPRLSAQLSDRSRWQRQRLQGPVLDEHLVYWRAQLKDLPVLHFRKARADSRPAEHDGALFNASIPAALSTSLRAFSRAQQVTPFMTLLALFKLLLSHSCGSEDLPVASLVANRSRLESEQMIGFLASRIVLRTRCDGNSVFSEFLTRVQHVCWGAYEHQDLSFWHFMSLTQDRDIQPPQTSFAQQSVPIRGHDFANLEVTPLNFAEIASDSGLGVSTGRYQQQWEIWERGEVFHIVILYRRTLFDASYISELAHGFTRLAERAIDDPHARVSDLIRMLES